ncbi:MAG: DNA-protecting protein DprA [Actinomycetota bacterium]|nr:DNA-protecting protein DprA [Actinomycetota bacterium]
MGATSEYTALVALLRNRSKGESWGEVTERVLKYGSAEAVWSARSDGALTPDPEDQTRWDAAAEKVRSWCEQPYRLVSILDPEYPARLRDIHQAPPFLFAMGALLSDDPAIAVVGSRKASARGLGVAANVANELALRGVTVLSGLAAGVDSAAHTAALDANGRTVALIGTGITRYYPASNRQLQDRVAREGLVLSQFWPDGPPQPHNFLMRNAVMSGYGRATVVVEAGEHSGARAQARMAVEHGRPVILTDQVVQANEWARKLVDRPGVHTAANVTAVMRRVDDVLDRDQRVKGVLAELLGAGL